MFSQLSWKKALPRAMRKRKNETAKMRTVDEYDKINSKHSGREKRNNVETPRKKGKQKQKKEKVIRIMQQTCGY